MKRVLSITLCILLAAIAAFAQDTKSQNQLPVKNFYKVVFVISESENGKVTNQRSYSMTVREDRTAQMKTGNRIPIATGNAKGENAQIQYMDVGFNADATVNERDGKIELDAMVDITSMLPVDPSVPTPGGTPILRQMRQHFNSLLDSGKPTPVTSMDDVNSKKTVQVEVTVTRQKNGV